jgi:predicted deacylase
MLRDVSVRELPTGERLRIVKHRFMPIGLDEAEVSYLPRACVITGMHGDELEGQYVIYELVRRLQSQPQNLAGVIDVYPAVNPMGMGAIERGIPQFDLDMDRIFPGSHDASPFEAMAADLVEDVRGAQVAFDLHASSIFLRELPQIRVNEESAERLLPLAQQANVDYVWVHESAVVLKGTFAYSMNRLGVPTLVVKAGAGMRITPEVGEQLAIGILSVLVQVGVWTGPLPLVRSPLVGTDNMVGYLHAEVAGMFVPCISFGREVRQGQVVGRIFDCGSATVLQELRSPVDGLLFTLREYPLVYPGNLIARVLGGASC